MSERAFIEVTLAAGGRALIDVDDVVAVYDAEGLAQVDRVPPHITLATADSTAHVIAQVRDGADLVAIARTLVREGGE